MLWPRVGSTRLSAEPAAMRKNPGPRSESIRSATVRDSGILKTSAPSCGTSSTRASIRASRFRFFPLELDRAQRLALHPAGKYPHRAALFRSRAPRGASAAARLCSFIPTRNSSPASSRSFCTAACAPSDASLAPAPSAPMPIRFPRLSRRCSPSAARSARIAPSITTKRDRWS